MTETVNTTRPYARPVLAFVGAGRAGSALAARLSDVGYRVSAVHSRTPAHAAALAARCGATVIDTAAMAAQLADITFLTVPDIEIPRVAAAVAAAGARLEGRALVHCSATSGPEAIAAASTTGAALGACHPLQALTGAASAELLRGSTFTVEAAEPLRSALTAMVAAVGGHLLELPAGARARYHAAAVLAGNAPLALLARATALLEEAGIPTAVAHRALAALLEGAAHNAAAGGPAAALTGPVVRGDADTVARHLQTLDADPGTRELYRRLALEMLALAGPEGRERVADVLAPPSSDRSRPPARVLVHPRVA